MLFRPKASLTPGERNELFDAMRATHREIPTIRRFIVGTRFTTGFPYDALARDFPYFALLEFASKADLDTYLTHPAHVRLGDLFYLTSDAAEAYDFALSDVGEGLDTLRSQA